MWLNTLSKRNFLILDEVAYAIINSKDIVLLKKIEDFIKYLYAM